MKGIIFVVWERYLNDRFGADLLKAYRKNIGEDLSSLPMTGKTYSDDLFYAGLQEGSRLTQTSPDALMFEYGRYFMLNGLVEYLCGHLLAQSWNGYDLLLQMRDAHAQMRRSASGVMPPLFAYEVLSNDHNHMVLTYDSKRKLCSLLDGAIHGSAEHFGEKAHTRELSCMKKGHSVCRFEVFFEGESWAKNASKETLEKERQRLTKQGLTNLLLETLPGQEKEAMTLQEIKAAVDQHQGPYYPEIYSKQERLEPVHISQLHTGLAKLQQVGLVGSTVNQQGDSLITRRYWRAATID